MIRVTVWHEETEKGKEALFTDLPCYTPERKAKIDGLYPEGMGRTIAAFLEEEGVETRVSYLTDEEQGLSEAILEKTDVLVWWGHRRHQVVEDALVRRVCDRVLGGMGMIFLHSAHESKPFQTILGTSGALSWREDDDRQDIWAIEPNHPIAKGVPHIVLEHEETYAEPFSIPAPDELVYISSYEGGEVFRSGCCWKRGLGRLFYFSPGHETWPNLHHPDVQQVIRNAVHWAAPASDVKARPKSVHIQKREM
ncbi:MAG: trehalose utilization protein ThuA [Ruminococcaceae bacterium]|nr:trehalose utilization protein ThuA [Oscillospiraceae bacterium]